MRSACHNYKKAKHMYDFKMESADNPNTAGPNTLAMNMKSFEN